MFELHPKWKEAWTWLQTWLAAAVVAAPVAYSQFQLLQAYLAPEVFRYGMSALGVLMILNILRKKPETTP